ncbi:hypothetical protein FKM82_025065 [Ascaphus truei]
MLSVHRKCSLPERLIRAISSTRSVPGDSVASLIRRGVDVNCPHDTLMPLHCACMVCDAECVELLLENGARVDSVDGYQRTALHYAAEKDDACVETLLEFGADPNAPDGNQDTPLHWAAFKNMADCVRVLLEGGAKVNARDYNQDTPLSWAAMKGNLESMRLLLAHGALPEARNSKGQCPTGRLVALMGRGLVGEREEQCLELLYRASGRLQLRMEGGVPREAARDAQLCQRLARLCSDPGTLKGLTRRAVRGSMGERFLPQAVQALRLPKSLQDYVLLIE